MYAEDVTQTDGGLSRRKPRVSDDDAFQFLVVGQVGFVHPHLGQHTEGTGRRRWMVV